MTASNGHFAPMIAHGTLSAAVGVKGTHGHGMILLNDSQHQLQFQVPGHAIGDMLQAFRRAGRNADRDALVRCDFLELRYTAPYWLMSIPGLTVQPISRLDKGRMRDWTGFLSRIHAAMSAPTLHQNAEI